jgi:hypothetical protein
VPAKEAKPFEVPKLHFHATLREADRSGQVRDLPGPLTRRVQVDQDR